MNDEAIDNSLNVEVKAVQNDVVNTAEDLTENNVVESDISNIVLSQATTEVISVEETLGWAGGDSTNHNSLNGRSDPDQHTISAITGLSEKLKNIESLKSVQSDKIGCANYYKWANDERRDEYGYFVSFVDHSDTIDICSGGDIFGVTVSTAGFIGGQNEDTPRGNDYALVATSSLVDVRCESDVIVGDYVISNSRGIAVKTNSTCGYKVIAKENKNGVDYAAIVLGVQACTTDAISKNVQQLSNRMDDAETNIASAKNTANEAYRKAEESITSNGSMKDQIADALDKVDDMATDVDNIEEQVSDIATISAQAKAIAESAATSAESARNEAIEKANEALDKAGEIEKTVEPINNWKYTDPVTGETNTGATYFAEYVKNGLSTKAEMETVSRLDEENKLLIEKNVESYTQMLSSIDKYSIGEYSQAYGLTAEQAKNILKVGMIYIPTVDHIEPLFANGEREVCRNALYVWGGESWGGETLNIVWLGSNNPGSSYKYWYTELDEAEEGFEPHTLYINNDGEWVEVATLAGNVNNRITSMIRQDVNSISAEIVNAYGAVSGFDAKLSDTNAKVNSIASWPLNDGKTHRLATIEEYSDGEQSYLALAAGTKEDGTPEYLSGAKIVLNDSELGSFISLDADRINFSGLSTFFSTNENGGITAINGGGITTGTIQSPNYVSGKSGLKLDLDNGTVDVTGTINAQSGTIGGWTIDGGAIYKDSAGMNADPSYVKNTLVSTADYSISPIRFYCGDENRVDGAFTVLEDGSLYASAANITGTITANAGLIGGWTITTDRISNGDVGMYSGSADTMSEYSLISESTSLSPIRFYAGSDTSEDRMSDFRFTVLEDGSLYASAANITGTITANAGLIGGWTITSNQILCSNSVGSFSLSSAETSTYWIKASDKFKVSKDGTLSASGATISGIFDNRTSDGFGIKIDGNVIEFCKDSSRYGYIQAGGGYTLWDGSGSTTNGIEVSSMLCTDSIRVEGNLQIGYNSGNYIYVNQTCALPKGQIKVQTDTGAVRYLLFYNGILVGISGSQYTGVTDYSASTYTG